ncbi:putative disease resistance RPP13-like protein 1 [Rosa rugosa]|uniref:putative disease resistance RPP13-like protein 1 n=1 Tax=Rosa rugosa TaxID=74645 RepID=UPI002B413369|nr:putative disease resistance RPP13-like protein 1 [Rosa rugosa]XP_061996855.1 putative disease resistance RPP13-like protein 1 [Rosa rugosa]XP_061996856.1 putative disease resistance RPP13-like protein 1 [Rosa rugosa]XP_061996857.1 putative disease resistance RPP13-like protein 1 [Rosa rugosa]XP_061996858.1 putative disease resistance RPP13-like protein 1 [Rosa rugosa]XP_061996859.1 putative disease resistance RPP13-like protein 1 [Rosa rugosa]XP_061996860.1 putative disease resistance RPP1
MALFRGTNSSYPCSYHVFLSFRGEDTRKNFTDHLYTALVNAGFHTFRDDPELERGENIKEKLENAIRQSRSSVIVFSKDYTSSRWCLDELVMILERKRTSDHVVLPVFYDVNPSQLRKKAESLVRRHSGVLAKAFARLKKNKKKQSLEKLSRWTEALIEVTDLAGLVLENQADGHESKFIQKIVTEIQDKLARVPLTDVEEMLQKKLLFINPYLDDAEGKQLNNPTVKAWFNELKEAVYDTEDLLQEIKTEALRQKMEPESGSSSSKVQDLSSSLPSHAFDSTLIYPRVKEALNRLDSIMEKRKDVLGLESSAGCWVSQTLQSTSLLEDSGVCGRDDEKEKLIELLLSDDESGNKISVIPIVGMGGIGKTTLARLLYNDVRVEQHFDIQAWASVSEKFDVLRISQQIYESLTLDACNIGNLDLLQLKLKAALKGKMIFLVLDDMWNKNYTEWEVLRRSFQFGAHGSKIIVTTRNQDVACMVGTLETHYLMPMPEEDGWRLFEKHAFKNTGVGARTHLGEIGRQIVRKCKGLPLAIKSLAGLLCSKSNVGEWETILNSELWELPLESDILPSLWLSYMYLPSQLKHCFGCCSIFPKNYEFSTSELVYLWKAEDLLQPKKNKTIDEIGEDYFNDLISMSFFQVSSSSDQYFMHDLINDLASFVSGKFCLRWKGSDSTNNLSKTRHFSYFRLYHDEAEIFEALQQAERLHTFLPLDPYSCMKSSGISLYKANKGLYEALPKFQCLRMLKLSGYNSLELPDSINNLKHLKHLDLSSSSIKKLPDTICTLYNLQVLLLSNCRVLTKLPANLGRLINLSHLDIENCKNLKKMPPYMGKLKDLQMLPEFVLDKHTAVDNLAELKKLEKLRGRLCISGLVHSCGLEAYILRDKKFLTELVLDWGRTPWGRRHVSKENNNTVEEREVLEKLQPHLNLERLTIEHYGGKMFPGWSEYYFSSALVSLKLDYCQNCISLPPLGQLPSLRELHIEWLSAWQEWSDVGGDNNEGGVFPNLEKLEVKFCHNLTGRLASDSLPSLESLEVWDCPEFECFPEDGFPSKLKSLAIWGCKSMQNLNKGLRTLTSLEILKLNFAKLDWFAEERFPSTLTYLWIFRLNCETIDGAKWFGHLNSLQSLRIWNCPALRCLPESGLPTSLSFLEIYQCPLLQKRCQRETGEDWPKIAHINRILIDMVMI